MQTKYKQEIGLMKTRVPLERKGAIRGSQLLNKMRGRSLGALVNRMPFDVAALILGYTGSPGYHRNICQRGVCCGAEDEVAVIVELC